MIARARGLIPAFDSRCLRPLTAFSETAYLPFLMKWSIDRESSIASAVSSQVQFCTSFTRSKRLMKFEVYDATFSIDNGVACSNRGALLGTNAQLPLNNLIGTDLNQAFVLELDRTGVNDDIGYPQLFTVDEPSPCKPRRWPR